MTLRNALLTVTCVKTKPTLVRAARRAAQGQGAAGGTNRSAVTHLTPPKRGTRKTILETAMWSPPTAGNIVGVVLANMGRVWVTVTAMNAS